MSLTVRDAGGAPFGFATPAVAVGAVPAAADAAAAGITHVIDCRAEVDLSVAYAAVGVGYRRVPCHDDGNARPSAWYAEVVAHAEAVLADPDARLLIGCAAGRNRGPSAAYAVLRAVCGLDAAAARQAVTDVRPEATIAYSLDYDHLFAPETAGCLLCAAEPVTRRYAETEFCWVADCAVCGVPMVVWRHHGVDPPDADHVAMLALLDDAAAQRWERGRWVVDQARRSIPDHWHAHARLMYHTDDEWDAAMRTRWRWVARWPRPDPDHGWRSWRADDDGTLVSIERRAAWPQRFQQAVCTAPGPCADPPNPQCLCGIAFFGALDDFTACTGGPTPLDARSVWGLIRTRGPVRRDQGILGATWRCGAATIEALIVGPDDPDLPDVLRGRYGVPVHVAADPTSEAVIATARQVGLAAVVRKPAAARTMSDLADWPMGELAGAAWTTHAVGRHGISFVPAPGATNPRRPSARYTWYPPGHRFAFTAAECDAIAGCVAKEKPSVYGGGGTNGVVPYGGVARWLWNHVQQVMVAANATWWRLPLFRIADLNVNTYPPGQSLPWHTDNTPLDDRFAVSFVAMLSDPADYEGGRLEFHHDDEPTHVAQTRGTVFVFPATLLHRVTPVTAGIRRVLVAFAYSE